MIYGRVHVLYKEQRYVLKGATRKLVLLNMAIIPIGAIFIVRLLDITNVNDMTGKVCTHLH